MSGEDASEPESGASRSQFRLAVFAAVFGLLGTVVGGAVAYLGQRSLDDRQVHEQDARDRAAAGVAAALLSVGYQNADGALKAMIAINAYSLPRGVFDVALSAADEKLVIAHASKMMGRAEAVLGPLIDQRP